MTIAKGQPWGEPATLPADALIVRSDREISVALDDARRTGSPFPTFGLLAGDLCHTVGGKGVDQLLDQVRTERTATIRLVYRQEIDNRRFVWRARVEFVEPTGDESDKGVLDLQNECQTGASPDVVMKPFRQLLIGRGIPHIGIGRGGEGERASCYFRHARQVFVRRHSDNHRTYSPDSSLPAPPAMSRRNKRR